MKPINDQSRQRAILKEIFQGATPDWGPESAEQSGYILRLRGRNMNRLGPWSVDSPVHQPLLYITTYSGYGGRTAGLLAEENGNYHLYHDRRTRKIGLPAPYSEQEFEFYGVRYSYIGRIDDTIFSSIISYHASRLKDPGPAIAGVPAFSPGPKNSMGVPSHDKNLVARHYKICVALRDLCLQHGWILSSRKTCNPDLAVERGNSRLLFEVKPSGDFTEICAAIGQVLVYNKEMRATKMIVAPESEAVRKKVQSILQDLKIEWAGIDPENLSQCATLIDALKV